MSDEAENANGNGDGSIRNDIVIVEDGSAVNLRAERQGTGNTATATFDVQVPKSQSKPAAKDAPMYTVAAQ